MLVAQVVSNMWRSEMPEVKAHFKELADEEDQHHKDLFPQYRYLAGRRVTYPPLSKRGLPPSPSSIAIAGSLIDEGF